MVSVPSPGLWDHGDVQLGGKLQLMAKSESVSYSPGARNSEWTQLGGKLCLPLPGCEERHLLIIRRFPTPLWPNEGPGQTKHIALPASITDAGLSAP